MFVVLRTLTLVCITHLCQKDSWLIDYQASLNCLKAGRAQGAKHYVLLSAVRVQKPMLEFHRTKLAMEKALKVSKCWECGEHVNLQKYRLFAS